MLRIHTGFYIILVAYASLVSSFNATYDRFVYVPTGSNETHLVDLEAKPNLDILKSFKKIGDINKYSLYTRKNPNLGQNLVVDDGASVTNSNFNPNVPTAVLIHGWQSQPGHGLGSSVKKALLDTSNVNVIVVDWRILSSLDYVTAVAGVPSVGKNVGLLLEYINSVTGAPFSSMHLIGHSLGAHIAGSAGRQLDGQVARLTGLDPAGPIWYLNPNKLKKSDAIYVESIHTNGAGLGMENSIGHVDFYPNGGSLQPGCFSPVCHHGRSYDLFAASITNPDHLIGRKCSNFIQMQFDLCTGSELPLGNNDLRKTGSGIYRLDTGKKYPY